ncbi:MAG: nitroreductase [Deltaproteobacteria bacterium]|nr:MAG: nitroreductase [Deltaproteobacteria bacterium]
MELYQAIKERRSVRRYKETPVPSEVLDRIIEAAQWAPSWAHSQCVEVVIVDDPAKKSALQATLPETNPAYKAMVNAPLAVAFCAKLKRAGFKKGEPATPRGNGWALFDTALCMQNFMLAAHAEGLATVCVGLFDSEKAGAALNVPEGKEVVALTPLGYPDQEPNLPPRKDKYEFVKKNGY